MDPIELSDLVRQTAYEIHVYLGHGHLEKIYERALAHRLGKLGLPVAEQHSLRVYDEDGTHLGYYVADLIVASSILIELKTVRRLGPEHESQVLAYLKSCRLRHGLLINFGSYRFEIRKYASPLATSPVPL
jgi:GxxExxY protein